MFHRDHNKNRVWTATKHDKDTSVHPFHCKERRKTMLLKSESDNSSPKDRIKQETHFHKTLDNN